MSPEFKYLGEIIVLIFVEFSVVIFIVLYCFRRKLNTTIQQDRVSEDNFLRIEPFNNCYRGMPGIYMSYLLCLTRLLSFGYFSSISVIWNSILHNPNYFYFTTWNAELLAIYFLCALCCSVIGLLHSNRDESSEHKSKTVWSDNVKYLGLFTHVLFEVAGASALFVTTVAFSFLDPKFVFWNVSVHFVTTCAMLLEMSQNSMIVRREHIILNLGWVLTYLIFIIPMVVTNVVKQWPYTFLEMSDPSCFGWYTGLFIGNLIYYVIWYWLAQLKLYFRADLKCGYTEEDLIRSFLNDTNNSLIHSLTNPNHNEDSDNASYL